MRPLFPKAINAGIQTDGGSTLGRIIMGYQIFFPVCFFAELIGKKDSI
jgi:hypothetical protein